MTNRLYRLKPDVVEAVQFDGTDESVDWLLPQLMTGKIGRSCNRLHMQALEGVVTAEVGGYVVRNSDGEIHFCKPDIFNKTYEKVED